MLTVVWSFTTLALRLFIMLVWVSRRSFNLWMVYDFMAPRTHKNRRTLIKCAICILFIFLLFLFPNKDVYTLCYKKTYIPYYGFFCTWWPLISPFKCKCTFTNKNRGYRKSALKSGGKNRAHQVQKTRGTVYFVTCQAHSALVVIRVQCTVRSFSIFDPPVKGPKDPRPRGLSLPGLKVVRWRPHLTGTWQYVFVYIKHSQFMMLLLLSVC